MGAQMQERVAQPGDQMQTSKYQIAGRLSLRADCNQSFLDHDMTTVINLRARDAAQLLVEFEIISPRPVATARAIRRPGRSRAEISRRVYVTLANVDAT